MLSVSNYYKKQPTRVSQKFTAAKNSHTARASWKKRNERPPPEDKWRAKCQTKKLCSWQQRRTRTASVCFYRRRTHISQKWETKQAGRETHAELWRDRAERHLPCQLWGGPWPHPVVIQATVTRGSRERDRETEENRDRRKERRKRWSEKGWKHGGPGWQRPALSRHVIKCISKMMLKPKWGTSKFYCN